MTLEFDYWFSSAACAGPEDLAEHFFFSGNNASACVAANGSHGRLPAELSMRWNASSCTSGGFLKMWQSRDCTGTLLSNETVPANTQGGNCTNFSPGKSAKTLCSTPPPPPPPPLPHGSSGAGAAVAGTFIGLLALGCGAWAFRRHRAGEEISWSTFSTDVQTSCKSAHGWCASASCSSFQADVVAACTSARGQCLSACNFDSRSAAPDVKSAAHADYIALGVDAGATTATATAAQADHAAGRSSGSGIDAAPAPDAAEQAPSTPTDRAPRAGFSSAQSAGMRGQDPQGLVGAQVRVFDSNEGRVGVVTGIAKAFGGSSKHTIVFDGNPENVLLQKSTGGKGLRFHVLEQRQG